MSVKQNVKTSSNVDEKYNEGLRKYMLSVYNYMSLGIAFTAVVTLWMSMPSNIELLMFMHGPFKWVLFVAVLGLGLISHKLILGRSTVAAHVCFWSYALLWGLLISPMINYFINLPGGVIDIARAFFITSAMFAGASLYGYVTKRDLSGFGRFFMMAIIGLLISLFANIFISSSLLSLGLSSAVVILFAGITAYETQAIKQLYSDNHGSDSLSKLALYGAFELYGSFITMFIHVLNIILLSRD